MHGLRLGDFTVYPAAGEMVGPGGREQLDPKVMQVLVALARRAGDVVSRHELLAEVWPGVVVGDDVVSRCIYQLRRHLRQAGGDERYAELVETLPKRGYRLNCEPTDVLRAPSDALARSARADDDAEPPKEPVPAAAKTPARRRWLLAAGAALVLAGAACTFWFLQRADHFWKNPLADARYTRVTDFEGVARGVALSRDGKLIALLANRAGRLDVWIGQAGTGAFRNLTRGGVPGIDNPVRGLGFTPDASNVLVWNRIAEPGGEESVHTWAVPTAGGPPRAYLENVAEVDWSADGTRMVYHPAAPGDPLFVTDPNERTGRQIHVAPQGVHCHFPVWSHDGRFIYFVQGRPPDEMDIWRIASDGGEPERITFHASSVSYPVFLDPTTLLYLATTDDGSGPWLHGMDTRRRVPHRIGSGLEQYTSLAASADGRRLVATRTIPKSSLWRVPLQSHVSVAAERVSLPAAGGRAPRLGRGYLLFVSPSDGSGIRKLTADDVLTRLWSSKHDRLLAGPAIDPSSGRIAFSVAEGARRRLQVMNADGTALRTLAANLQVHGAPAWAPDGRSIVIAADQGRETRLFNVPLDGGPVVPLAAEYSRDAAWSPDASFLVFTGADVGPTFPVKALSADGRPHVLPELVLPRGARRLVFLPGENALVVLKGPAHDRNFWLVDLATGRERELSDFDPGFAIGDFDVSADGREIVFDQLREESDVVQIDLAQTGGNQDRQAQPAPPRR